MAALDTALLGALRSAGMDSNSISRGRPYFIGAQTASFTLKPSECYGGVFTNEGAAGAVIATLPPARAGMVVTGIATNQVARVFQFTPATGDQIQFSGNAVNTTVTNTSLPTPDMLLTATCVQSQTSASGGGVWLLTNVYEAGATNAAAANVTAFN